MILLWSSDLSLKGFVDHGELAIYSAAILAPSLHIVLRGYKANFPEREFWGLLIFGLLMLSLIVFAAAAAPAAAPDLEPLINVTAVRIITPFLYVSSLAVAFLLIVIRETLVSEPSLDEINPAAKLRRQVDEGFTK